LRKGIKNMTNIDELSRVIGQLEKGIETLTIKQDALCNVFR